MTVLIWGMVILGAVFLVRWTEQQNKSSMTNRELALEILRKRYARGEISKGKFEEKEKDLK
ncbi:MAG: SHOCT domain-containing protein [Bacteroidota bacterium]